MDDVNSVRIICEGGLNTNENSLALSTDLPGSATRLINFEPSSSGGYRRINGFIPLEGEAEFVSPTTSEGPVIGVIGFSNTKQRGFEFYAARKDMGTDEYSIYRLNSGAWDKITLPAVRKMVGPNTNVVRLRYETTNFGSGNHLFIVDGVNPMLWYDGSDWLEVKSDGSGSLTQPGGDQMLDAPSVIAVFKNHLFVGCDQLQEFVVAHSVPNDPINWKVADGGGQIFPGYDVVNIRPFRDELYVFGEEKIKKIVAEGTNFVTKDVTYDLGCIARDSVLEVGGNLIFLSQDGIRPVAGTEKINDVDLGLLSLDIQPNIDLLIAEGDLRSLVGIVIKKKTQFRYFYNSEALAVEDSVGLLGSVRRSRRTGRDWEFGELLGIRAYSTWSGMYSGREIVLHGDYNGGVYQQEVGNSFNNKDILSIYSTPYLDYGDTEIRKLNREIRTFARFEGYCEVLLGINFDWGAQNIVQVPNERMTDFSENTKYDYTDTVYDDQHTIYGGAEISVLKKNIRGSSNSTQFSFVSEGQFAPFIIQGFVLSITQKGRQ